MQIGKAKDLEDL